MHKTFSRNLHLAVIAACLTLAMGGSNAYASGYLVATGRSAGAGQTTTDEGCRTQMGSGQRCEAPTASGSGMTGSGGGVASASADEGGGGLGSGNILTAIGNFLISIFR